MSRIMSLTPSPSKFYSTAAQPGAGPLGAITGGVALLWAGLLARRRANLTRKILEGLDDRTLHDIGIDRSEIGSVVTTRAAEHRVHYDQLY
ncbi:MAG: DUF1127 domain-containing protein [Hyphomicrobiaceae bacterium]